MGYYPIVEINGNKYSCDNFKEAVERDWFDLEEGLYYYSRKLTINFIMPADDYDVLYEKLLYDTTQYDITIYDILKRKYYTHSFNEMLSMERIPIITDEAMALHSQCQIAVTIKFEEQENKNSHI